MNTDILRFSRLRWRRPKTGLMPGRSQLLARARLAIRQHEIDLAEAFVLENGPAAWCDAACLNVLGLIAEARSRWPEARRRWSRSLRRDPNYQPARQNLLRYFELVQFGGSHQTVALGDEPRFAKPEVA